MNRMKRATGCLAGVFAWLAIAGWAGELRFAPLFGEGAVLQCELPVNVWGTAAPGAAVELRLDGKRLAAATADATGRWKAVLPEQAPGGAHVLEAVAGAEAQKINEVWFGEVWLATGQSNMVVPLRNTAGGEERLAMTLPEIRFVKVPQKTGLPVEKAYTADELAWKAFKPGPNGEVAAVAFYFAEQIQKATGRKIGLVQSSFGGTPCEAWTPAWALDAHPELKYLADEIRKGLAAGKTGKEWMEQVEAESKYRQALKQWNSAKQGPRPKDPGQPGPGNPWSQKSPTVLYENMIVPLVPYTARGIIWYQGEGNSGKPDEYRVLFPAMIEAWRKVWSRPDLPFLFVQLAAYNHPSTDWPGLRAAQAFTRDTVPHTGMAVAIDVGEKENIHPQAKQPVGERLARLALAQVYGQKTVARGPAFERAECKEGRMLVTFRHVEAGLKTGDGKPEVPGFELAGSDGKFQTARARIASANEVELTCGAVPAPVAVRYAWANWVEPPVTLQNSAGLPAEPFQLPQGKATKAEAQGVGK